MRDVRARAGWFLEQYANVCSFLIAFPVVFVAVVVVVVETHLKMSAVDVVCGCELGSLAVIVVRTFTEN